MRCWRLTGGFGRAEILALCVAVVSALVMTGPASARSHTYSHRHYHYHFARRHGAPLRAENVAAAYQYGFPPFAQAYARPQHRARVMADRWTQNDWSSNSWSGMRSQSESWNSWNRQSTFGGAAEIGSMAAAQASAAGVPVSLVNRVIKRESGGNPRAVSRGNYGLMQIRLGTARAMGYSGSAEGLLDPSTNMTYAVRYLAGAYRAAGGNESRAVALYARGYRATPRVQEASYYGEQPQAAGFSGGAYYDSYAQPRMVRRERHYRHRES